MERCVMTESKYLAQRVEKLEAERAKDQPTEAGK